MHPLITYFDGAPYLLFTDPHSEHKRIVPIAKIADCEHCQFTDRGDKLVTFTAISTTTRAGAYIASESAKDIREAIKSVNGPECAYKHNPSREESMADVDRGKKDW